MKVILFKLDNPGNKHEWWVKDVVIKNSEDVGQIMGVCAEHSYSEIYHVDKNDDLFLIEDVRKYLKTLHPITAKDTIMRLFKMIEMIERG